MMNAKPTLKNDRGIEQTKNQSEVRRSPLAEIAEVRVFPQTLRPAAVIRVPTRVSTLQLAELLTESLSDVRAKTRVPVILQCASADETLYLPKLAATELVLLFERWARTLVRTSVEDSVEERVSADREGALTIVWSLRKGRDGRVIFEVTDDGAGSADLEAFGRVSSRLVLSIANFNGGGSRLRAQVPVEGFQVRRVR